MIVMASEGGEENDDDYEDNDECVLLKNFGCEKLS